MAILAQDSFNRTNSTTTLGTTPVGGFTWQKYGTQQWGITASTLAYPVTFLYDYPTYIDVGVSDNIAYQITHAVWYDTNQMMFRIQDASNYILLEGNVIYEVINGEYVQIAEIGAVSSGSIIRVELRGSEYQVYLNGVLGTTFTNNNFLTATKFGFSANTAQARYDDFLIEDFGTVVDTTPPAEVTNVSDTKTSTSITLNWTKPNDPDFSHVRILRDGVQIATNLTGTTYTDSGRAPFTLYAYDIITVDALENASTGVERDVRTLPASNVGTVLARDSFDRANSTTTLGSTTVGNFTWQKYGTQQWGIQGNRAYPVTRLYESPTYIDVGVSDNLNYHITQSVFSINNQIMWRIQDATNYFLLEETGIFIVVNGVFTSIGGVPMIGDGSVIRIELRGTQHQIFVNGVLGLTFNDNRFLNATKFGFSSDNTLVRYDDLLIETVTVSDTTPPANVTNVTSSKTTNSVTLNWTNPTDSDFSHVRILRDGTQIVANQSGTTFTDTGRSEGTTYNYSIRSVDTTGNESTGTAVAVTTDTSSDTTPPAEVINLMESKTSNSVTLTWLNPTDPDFSHVKIYRNNVQIANNITNQTYLNSGLAQMTVYTYRVATVDMLGNESVGVELSVTILNSVGDSSVIIAQDNFNRANNSSTLGSTPTGNFVWQKYGTQQWGVQDNRAYPVTYLYDYPTFVDVGLSNNVNYQITNSINTIDGQIMWRIQDERNYFLLENEKVFSAVNGVYTNLGVTGAITNGSVLRIELRGSQHQLFINGNLTLTFNDSRFSNATKFGFSSDNNIVRYDDFTIEAFQVTDTTPPAEIIALTSTKTAISVRLNWTNPSDSDFSHVRILRNGVEIANDVTDTTYLDEGLIPMTNYDYIVKTVDATGNESVGIVISEETLEATGESSSIVAWDNFDRANSTTTLGTTPTGGFVWQKYGVQQWGISSSRAYPVTLLYDSPTYVDVGLSDNVNYQITHAVWNNTNQIMWRIQDDQNYFLLEGNLVFLMNNGRYTTLGEVGAVANGSVIKVELRGIQHRILVDGVLKFTFENTGFLTSTKYGFSANSSTARYDEFVIDSVDSADTTPPDNVTSVTATKTTASVTLNWVNPNTVDFSHVRITRDGEQIANNYNGSSFTDAGRSAGTTHIYSIKSVDQTGNESVGYNISVTTNTINDTTPPADVSNVMTTESNSFIRLDWVKPQDSDFSHVAILRNGTQLANNLTGLYYIDNAVTPSTPYSYKIIAVDTSGNQSTGITINTSTNDNPPSAPPYPIMVEVEKSKISPIQSMDMTVISFSFDKDVVEWTVNVMGGDPTTGIVADSGGAVISGQRIEAVIDWTELYQEGENRVNIYGKNASGLWTPYDAGLFIDGGTFINTVFWRTFGERRFNSTQSDRTISGRTF